MGTKIINAAITKTSVDDVSDYYIALGVEGGTSSINMKLSELQAWLSVVLDKIVEGDSKVEVVDDTDSAYVTLVLDDTEIIRFTSNSIYPATTDSVDIGSLTNMVKDICMSGAINLESDGSDDTGDIYYRTSAGKLGRLAIGDEGQTLTVTSGVPSWGDNDVDFVPNYFLSGGTTYDTTGVTTAVTAFNKLDDLIKNTIGGTGANIYLQGFFQMDDDTTWDLTNVRFYGNGVYFVVNDQPVTSPTVSDTEYSITVSDGNPTFENIQFYGGYLGAESLTFASYDTREIFILSEGNGQDATFKNCKFNDIVGGTDSGNGVIRISSIAANTTSVLVFENCKVSSHNNNIAFDYDGFTIKVDADFNGTLNVSVIDQQLVSELDSSNSSIKYTMYGTITSTGRLLTSCDLSAYYDTSNIVNSGELDYTSPVTNLTLLDDTTVAGGDIVMLGDVSDNDTIKGITLLDLQKVLGGALNAVVPTSKTLAYSDITGLGSEVTLIDAPGSDKAIQVSSIIYNLDASSSSNITLATEDLRIKLSTGDTMLTIDNADFNGVTTEINNQYTLNDKVGVLKNKALVCQTTSGGSPSVTGTDVSMTFFISYNIIDFDNESE